MVANSNIPASFRGDRVLYERSFWNSFKKGCASSSRFSATRERPRWTTFRIPRRDVQSPAKDLLSFCRLIERQVREAELVEYPLVFRL